MTRSITCATESTWAYFRGKTTILRVCLDAELRNDLLKIYLVDGHFDCYFDKLFNIKVLLINVVLDSELT